MGQLNDGRGAKDTAATLDIPEVNVDLSPHGTTKE